VYVGALRGLLPPARDNQRAAEVLARGIGAEHPFLSWVVVRPDALHEGDVSEYRLSEGLVASLFRPDATRMANVAHFVAELVTDDATWRRWRGKMPVIADAVGGWAGLPSRGGTVETKADPFDVTLRRGGPP
jgi:hypothetical protein